MLEQAILAEGMALFLANRLIAAIDRLRTRYRRNFLKSTGRFSTNALRPSIASGV